MQVREREREEGGRRRRRRRGGGGGGGGGGTDGSAQPKTRTPHQAAGKNVCFFGGFPVLSVFLAICSILELEGATQRYLQHF